MSAFPDWQQYTIKQKRPNTGCVPTGYEMILRAAGYSFVNFETFQDEFDLDKNLKKGEQPRNNFESVAQAVQSKHPKIHFKSCRFPKGDGPKKLAMVEEMVSQRLPVLISIPLNGLRPQYTGRGWHIMPVVNASADALTILERVDENNAPQTIELLKKDFVAFHENYAGGDDIAFLEQPHDDKASSARL